MTSKSPPFAQHPGLDLPVDKRQEIINRLAKEAHTRLRGVDNTDVSLAPNEELTKRLQKEEKYVKFNAWCAKYGVKSDAIEYPVAFGEQGLIGARATRYIGIGESYIYVPAKITINVENFKRSWVGEVYQDNLEYFEDLSIQAPLIFFVAYQLTLGAKSFWHPYFEINQDPDLPMYWEDEELAQLEDNVLRMAITEELENIEEEYEEALELASKYKRLINPDKFTLEVYKRAYSIVMTRAFGASLPYLMLVPMADNLNHACVANNFELFNSRLTKSMLRKEITFNNFEKAYFTKDKLRMNFMKHFSEDQPDSKTDPGKVYYASNEYYKTLKLRDKLYALDPEEFKNGGQYKDVNIWELNYQSTSDEDDVVDADDEEDDGEEEESEEEEEEEEAIQQKEDHVNKAIFEKKVKGQGRDVPDIVRRLKPKENQREKVRYQYNYKTDNGEALGEEPKKSIIIKKKDEWQNPHDLIELLTREKQALWHREQNMRLLKEQDEAELAAMQEEYNRSDTDEEEENFAWYDINDSDTYFVLATMNTMSYKKDDQVFHNYGRRTNQYFVSMYGFCLSQNKYNSLNFKVNLDFGFKTTKETKKANEDLKVTKIIKIKEYKLRDEVCAYVRANLIHSQEKEQKKAAGSEEFKQHLLVSSPVDPQFEMLVVGCVINLLEGLGRSRYKQTLEWDLEYLKKAGLSQRQVVALMYRIGQKKILKNNIKLLNVLMRILARYQGGTPSDIKQRYMQRVDEFESKEEIIPNRLKLRKYLRELASNQRRIFEAAADRAKLQQPKPNTPQNTKPNPDPEIAETFTPFLQALDLKLKESGTPYFDSKNQPTRSIDKAMYDEINKKSIGGLITPKDMPSLFAWRALIGRFSEEAIEKWPE